MTPIQRLIAWAADTLANGPELGDARTQEGSDILRDVRANLHAVEYRGEQYRVPLVKLQGNYVCSCRVNADATTVLILELPESIKPGDEATEEQCAASKPVLAVSLTNTGSLDAIGAWIARVAEKMEQAAKPAVLTRDYVVGVDMAQEGGDRTIVNSAAITEHDWPEDFVKGEGRYACTCRVCHAIFHGDKRRITCRKCAH
jgi:hypothetical protein